MSCLFRFAEKVPITWDFPYADDLFTTSDVLSPDLARASFGLSVSTFRNDGRDLPNQYATYLKGEDIIARTVPVFSHYADIQ